MGKKQRHHVFPRRWRNKENGTHEVKFVEGKKHRLFHQLTGDMSPEQAIKYIAETFLPSNIKVEVRYI